MPKIDFFTVEDEEGSDPHANAYKYHIDNERKLLVRFGGKDFVIKYEGSCNTENSDSLVLKHAELDMHEVLRKDISISELQWYGYCMFAALRSLHKQGVVHTDVKPGNFLFSRKTCIDSIIDFNLAKVLHLKQVNTGIYLNPHLQTVSPSKRRKILDTKAAELAPVGFKKGYKPIESKMLRIKALESHRNSIASQGAHISGLNSAKVITSTTTPSAERLREPLPCQGHKEFNDLAQEEMQTLKQEVTGVLSYKRKRVAAPSATMDIKLVHGTPMPINSSGIAVPSSGFFEEGEGKKQKEGSCSGTKGFRAPENLQRTSPAKTMKHQQDLLVQKVEEQSKEQIDDDIQKCLTGAVAFPIENKTKLLSSIQEKSDHIGSKAMPKFDIYTVEGEEGSGGYGTVYRAQRKSDGMRFAIKYPHPNANKYHIDNERKLLERFGGHDFVITYEGSCKSENSDCLVLKHVEHDRPDVLRKDISISELQWYGFCMFTALKSLHRQGVVHRDVKPGNFLFSRKTRIGYIIDFNLAKVLHPKQANTGICLNPHLQTGSTSKRRKILDTKASSELAPVGFKKGYKPIESKGVRNKALESHRNSITSQGADISGLTSVKDITSTRTPSADRLREPLPCHGRKEFINLAQEAMQTQKQEVAGGSSYKRKRTAAPSATMDRKLVHCTPMPINSSGIAVPGSGFFKEGEGKKQKEGSCSGTKGFRAPEVLLRSMHQGTKLDVWSAGVTFLYLMTGKMPFTGEPEQNMKDIVKLRGSEELWELAKLHDRESSFPKELYDVQYLQSMELRNWCKANTKKPEFVKAIPSSLFDLADKCLTVNPRLRISAEEALRHEFFAPCVDTLIRRKTKRLLKQRVPINSSK